MDYFKGTKFHMDEILLLENIDFLYVELGKPYNFPRIEDFN